MSPYEPGFIPQPTFHAASDPVCAPWARLHYPLVVPTERCLATHAYRFIPSWVVC